MNTKFLTAVALFMASSGLAIAGAPSPAPLVGAVGGPAGIIAAVVCYGGYRLYKAKFSAK